MTDLLLAQRDSIGDIVYGGAFVWRFDADTLLERDECGFCQRVG